MARNAVIVLLLSASIACAANTPDSHLARASEYLEAGSNLEAIIELRSGLQLDPKRGDLRLKLAQTIEIERDFVAAAHEYVRAADLLTEDAAVQLRAGQYLLRANQFEDARSRADRALAIDPANVDAMILLGNAMAGLNDFDAAVAEYQEAIALNPAADSAYMNIGVLQMSRGRQAEAEATFRKAVSAAPRSVPARMALANFLWSTGRQSEAETVLKETLAQDSANLAAHRALGVFYIATDRLDAAEPHFRAIAESARTAGARIGLADYYVAAKKPDQARTILDELARDRATYAVATVRIAALEALRNNVAVAFQLLHEVIERHPNDMAARTLNTRLLLASGRTDDALTAAQAIVKDDPASQAAADAFMVIGNIEAARDRREEALRAYEQVLPIDSRPIDALIAIAGQHLQAGAIDRAATAIQQALGVHASNPTARAMQVRVLLAQGETQRAGAELATLQKQFPDSVPVLNLAAVRLEAEKRFDAARAAYARVLEIAPADHEALAGVVALDLRAGRRQSAIQQVEAALKRRTPTAALLVLAARTHLAAGDAGRGEALLKEAIDADPARLTAYSLLGELYVRQNRVLDARKQFEAVVVRNPRSVSAHTMLGLILEAVGDRKSAEAQYVTTLGVDPNAAVAANNLAWMYASENRNLDQALQLAQTAYQQLPEHPVVADTLGWVYYQRGIFGQAVQYLEIATKKAPEDAVGHYHLGMAYWKAGDARLARQALSRALKISSQFEGADEARKALAELGG